MLVRFENVRQGVQWTAALVVIVLAASAFRAAVSLPDTTATVIWPTVGLLVGFLLISDLRLWWLICLLVFAVEYPFAIGSFAYEPTRATLAKVAAYYGLLVLGCFLLRRRHPDGLALHRLTPDLRDFLLFVLGFCVLIGIVEPLFASAAGGLSFGGLGWYHWAISNAASIIVAAPAVVAWTTRAANVRPTGDRGKAVEFLALSAAITMLVAAAAYVPDAVSQTLYNLVWIPLLWCAFRFDIRFVALVALWAAVNVSVALAAGAGPFRLLADVPADQVLASSGFILSAALVLLLLSAVLSGREELRRKKDRLSEIIFESNRLHTIGAFAAGLAHDWNNLMLVLSFERDNLRERSMKDRSLKDSADTLDQIVGEGRAITSQLLSLARRDNEPLTVCNLADEVRVVADLARRALPPTCRLYCDFGEGRGPFVMATRSYLHQVFLNLIFNARDAMVDERGTVTIEVQGPRNGAIDGQDLRVAVVYVIDDGAGMDGEVVKRVFEPLFTTRADSGGTGLGLSVARSLVSALAGDIAVSSQPGRGTTLSVTLPVVDESA